MRFLDFTRAQYPFDTEYVCPEQVTAISPAARTSLTGEINSWSVETSYIWTTGGQRIQVVGAPAEIRSKLERGPRGGF